MPPAFVPGELPPFHDLGSAELYVQPRNWVVQFLAIDGIDYDQGIVTTRHAGTYPLDTNSRWAHAREGSFTEWHFRVENVLEYLDAPGRWMHDSVAGRLYYWPRSGEKPGLVYAPRLREIIQVAGDLATHELASHIQIEGLTFAHAARLVWDDARLDTQHGWEVFDQGFAAIYLRGARDIRVRDCRFEFSGGSAVKLGIHTYGCEIAHNEMRELGGAGVAMVGYGPGLRDENHDHRVVGNHIHHIGRLWSHSPGIYLTNSGCNRVADNLIHDTPYSGIVLVGGREGLFRRKAEHLWDGYGYVEWEDIPEEIQGGQKWYNLVGYIHTRHNVIEHNEIHHVLQTLVDGNGIYLSGAGVGNVVRRNFIHDSAFRGGAAMRSDDCQFFARFCENVVWRIDGGAMCLKCINDVDSNVFVDCSIYSVFVFGAGIHHAFSQAGANVRRNIMVQYTGRRAATDQPSAGGAPLLLRRLVAGITGAHRRRAGQRQSLLVSGRPGRGARSPRREQSQDREGPRLNRGRPAFRRSRGRRLPSAPGVACA